MTKISSHRSYVHLILGAIDIFDMFVSFHVDKHFIFMGLPVSRPDF